MFAIREVLNGMKRNHSTYETFEQAKRVALDTFSIAHIEDDADFPGEAADFLTTGGVVYAIERI